MALTESLAETSAPVEPVYDISQDDAVRYDWDLFPGRIEPLSPGGAAPTVDAQVRVRPRLGMGRVVAFVQEDAPQRAAVSMVAGHGSWPVRGHVDLPAEELGRTRARCRYTAAARPAWQRFIIEPVAAYFSSVVGRRLAGLKTSCERQAGTGFAG